MFTITMKKKNKAAAGWEAINVWRLVGDTLNVTLTFCIVIIRCKDNF
jgi:hypothetical protein